jgi:hypothetical protein
LLYYVLKLFRGDISFDKEERQVLQEFVKEKGVDNVREFVRGNKYVTPSDLLLFEKGTCALAEVLKMADEEMF